MALGVHRRDASVCGCLGVVAVREYYLAMFLNQVLPGGVLGDVTRAWRHARLEDTGRAVRAVVFERASGQLVMTVVTGVSLARRAASVAPDRPR